MSEELELPISWLRLKLGDIIDYGKADRAEPSEIPADAWVLELEDIEKDTSRLLQRLTFAERQSKSTKNHFKPGDVLYGKLRPYLNKVIVADQVGYCTTEILPLKPHEGLYGRFLFYWLKHPEFLDYVAAVSHGINMPRLGTEAGLQAPFILAPLAEQKRIADKLGALLARVDQCRARLDRVPLILKRFRQAVLAAATSGQLTEDWREDNPNARLNPGENSIPEIHSGLFDLPGNWTWVALESICEHIVDCPHSTPKWADSGYICVRTTNFKPGYLDLSEVSFVTEQTYRQRIERLTPKVGDILYSREGGILGIACMIPESVELCLGQRMMLMRTGKSYLPTLLMSWLNSPEILRQVRELTGGTASPHLNVRDIKNFPVPLPPLDEQHEIVRRVETLFAYADRLAARYQAARAQVEQLTPALLAKAFRGELVPQDPADEPATVLLARVRAARMESGEERPQPKQASLPFE